MEPGTQSVGHYTKPFALLCITRRLRWTVAETKEGGKYTISSVTTKRQFQNESPRGVHHSTGITLPLNKHPALASTPLASTPVSHRDRVLPVITPNSSCPGDLVAKNHNPSSAQHVNFKTSLLGVSTTAPL